MGLNRKFQASASCEGQGTCSGSVTGDRFSNLPDEVAHHILSSLSFNDLTRFSGVSKRCTRLYLSVPLVDFGASRWERKALHQKLGRLMSSLDRYLFYRGDNRMQRFCISWSFFSSEMAKKFSDDHFRVITWIHNAVRCNVEELDLCFLHVANSFSLPSCVFLSQYLRSLSVDLGMQILEVPSLSISNNLHYLGLANVKIVDERIFEWISCCCKCIKKLKLSCIVGIQNITIESSSLENFYCWIYRDLVHLNVSGEKLETIDIHLWSDGYPETSSRSLKIFTPNLKNLKWKGRLEKSQIVGKQMSLENVELLLKPRVNDFDNVYEVLCSICCAKVLTINDETIQALFKEGPMVKPILHNICDLSVHCRNLNDDLVPAAVSLLRGMPNLNILYIKTTSQWILDGETETSSGIGMEYWKLQNLAFLHQLNEVTIEYSHGSNEIQFARFILRMLKI